MNNEIMLNTITLNINWKNINIDYYVLDNNGQDVEYNITDGTLDLISNLIKEGYKEGEVEVEFNNGELGILYWKIN